MQEEGIVFTKDTETIINHNLNGRVINILCIKGSLFFLYSSKEFTLLPSQYLILPPGAIISSLRFSDDFEGIMMTLDWIFLGSSIVRSNYGIICQLSLLQNPIINLSSSDFERCLRDMERLEVRVADHKHLFRTELLHSLLAAHVLDLYDIIAHQSNPEEVSQRKATLLRKFIEMLFEREYRLHRDIPYYAEALCITPHYLTEVCKEISGYSAQYWIDRFTTQEIVFLLHDKTLTISDIVERLNFSSQSYFTRYVTKHLGVGPSKLR